jgi:hypothetical protein
MNEFKGRSPLLGLDRAFGFIERGTKFLQMGFVATCLGLPFWAVTENVTFQA